MKSNCECWYVKITKQMVRENPEGGLFKPEHVGLFLIRECVDLFNSGQIVSELDIKRQLGIWDGGSIRDSFATGAEYEAWRQAIITDTLNCEPSIPYAVAQSIGKQSPVFCVHA